MIAKIHSNSKRLTLIPSKTRSRNSTQESGQRMSTRSSWRVSEITAKIGTKYRGISELALVLKLALTHKSFSAKCRSQAC